MGHVRKYAGNIIFYLILIKTMNSKRIYSKEFVNVEKFHVEGCNPFLLFYLICVRFSDSTQVVNGWDMHGV